MTHSKLRSMAECAIFAAILCMLSPVGIKIGPVPITLASFAVMLCGVVLDWKRALISVFVYLALGLFLPVFSGGHTGVTALPGPTGGYIWSFLLMIPIIRGFAGAPVRHRATLYLTAFIGCAVATALCYLCGTLQYAALSGKTISEVIAVCVLPFIVPDMIKAVVASVLGVTVREILKTAGLL